MATLYEHWNTGRDALDAFSEEDWDAQTFTPTTAHVIQIVKVFVKRSGPGTVGTVTLGIRATSANEPTGNDLAWGTTDGDDISTSWAWVEIPLSTYTTLSASTKYAIVIRCPDASIAEWEWGSDSDATYTGGEAGMSADSGATWSMAPAGDFLFEEWGVAGSELTGRLSVVDTQLRYQQKSMYISCQTP